MANGDARKLQIMLTPGPSATQALKTSRGTKIARTAGFFVQLLIFIAICGEIYFLKKLARENPEAINSLNAG